MIRIAIHGIQGDNMPIQSVFLTGAVVDDKIYIMGGSTELGMLV